MDIVKRRNTVHFLMKILALVPFMLIDPFLVVLSTLLIIMIIVKVWKRTK